MASEFRQERLADIVLPMVAAKVSEILRPSTIYFLIALCLAQLFCFSGIGLWAWGKFNHQQQLLDTALVHRGVLDKQVAKLQAERGLEVKLDGINESLTKIAGALGVEEGF